MGQILDRDVARQATALGKVLLKDADELAAEMADSIQAAVPIYRRADIVTTEQLRQASLANIEVIFTELGGAPATSSARSYDNGRARARAGVPLTAVMAAYRVAAAFLWEKLAQAARDSAAGAEVIVAAATQMWLVLDTFTTEMADGYREEITAQAIFGEQQRSSLVQAILHGQLTDTNLWEAAETLRLPTARYLHGDHRSTCRTRTADTPRHHRAPCRARHPLRVGTDPRHRSGHRPDA